MCTSSRPVSQQDLITSPCIPGSRVHAAKGLHPQMVGAMPNDDIIGAAGCLDAEVARDADCAGLVTLEKAPFP